MSWNGEDKNVRGGTGVDYTMRYIYKGTGAAWTDCCCFWCTFSRRMNYYRGGEDAVRLRAFCSKLERDYESAALVMYCYQVVVFKPRDSAEEAHIRVNPGGVSSTWL